MVKIMFLFFSASVTACNGLTAVACYLCIHDVNSAELMAFNLWHVDLFLWTRSQVIGFGDVSWRIIANSIFHVIGNDIQLAAVALQIFIGHNSGSEAAIHAMYI